MSRCFGVRPYGEGGKEHQARAAEADHAERVGEGLLSAAGRLPCGRTGVLGEGERPGE
ncbi:hypothetical protein ACFYXH_13740 [Streptomyces sp. NPDC002730]|uniref:hypothetical protein n=1 Tax=Streptomyces sp. NPDC002730 TaxID=3364662 RepID=UPI0036CCB3D1